MSYEISPDQPNAFVHTVANQRRQRALVGRIREFETIDKEEVMTERIRTYADAIQEGDLGLIGSDIYSEPITAEDAASDPITSAPDIQQGEQ